MQARRAPLRADLSKPAFMVISVSERNGGMRSARPLGETRKSRQQDVALANMHPSLLFGAQRETERTRGAHPSIISEFRIIQDQPTAIPPRQLLKAAGELPLFCQ